MSIFYLIFILLAAYFSYRYDSIEEYDSHKQHRLWLMCGYMICLAGFSYGLGGDKFTYMDEFEFYPSTFSEAFDYIITGLLTRGQMPLWTLINIICKSVFDSFYVVQFVQSAAINIAVCYIVSKYTHRYFLFLLLYFFSLKYFIFNCEVMREGFALAIMMIGMHWYMNGKKWLFYVLLPFALMFHISAFVAILFPFVNFKLSWKTLYIAIVISFGLWLASDFIMGKVFSLAFGGEGAFAEKAILYSMRSSTIFGFIRSAFTFLVFPFITMYTATLYAPTESQREILEKYTSVMVLFGVMAGALAGFSRIYNYITIPYLILFAEFVFITLSNREHFIIRLGTTAGTLLLMLLPYFDYYKSTNAFFYEYYYPYTCILNEDKQVYVRQITHIESVGMGDKGNNVREIE